MHPILSSSRRLFLYIVAWIAPAVLLAYLLAGTGLAPWRADVLATALMVVFAFGCLPAWYSCRTLPLARHVGSALGAQAVSAAAAGTLWMLLARLLAFMFGWPQPAGASLLVVWVGGALLYALVAAGYYLALELERAGEADRRAQAAHALAQEAELRALKAQINPHFLYNSLNSISALTSADPERAREMCVRLGDFLRRTLALGQMETLAPLSEELALTHSFLAVEQIRFGARLRFEEHTTPEALAARLPPLTLQPLVENAVVHGISQLLEGGTIRLEAACRGGELVIEVENPYDPEAGGEAATTGLGLANVRARLKALFAGAARLQLDPAPPRFQVTLAIPLQEG
ncbi:MAG: sensor histidine kinase [Terriglobales bacterium]